ncbi:MAG: hypothetical protein WCW47_02875 [Candidatus Paceibacterota bacterium]|jgi:hypothetical protein
MDQVRLVSTLKTGELSVKGEKRLKRLVALRHIRLDAVVFLFFWCNQHLIPETWKERVNGNIQFITFDGTVLRNPGGLRCVLYLYWGNLDGKWRWDVRWLGGDFNVINMSAVLAPVVQQS